MISTTWNFIPDFPSYSVSTSGHIRNDRTGRILATSRSNFGHVKVTLRDRNGYALTRSVALLVAQAFVVPPDDLSDSVILLDGNLENVDVSNLALRPRWFAWKYARQLRIPPRANYLWPVYNQTINRPYPSIVFCGMQHGLLFEDIWRSANTGIWIYPFGWRFEFMEH